MKSYHKLFTIQDEVEDSCYRHNNYKISNEQNEINNLIKDALYTILYKSSWQRVKIISPVDNNGYLTCRLVDIGEHIKLTKDQLYNLEPEFKTPKFQVYYLNILSNVLHLNVINNLESKK